jgi:hypothetical protein
VGRQTPPIADEVSTRQGDERRQFFQEGPNPSSHQSVRIPLANPSRRGAISPSGLVSVWCYRTGVIIDNGVDECELKVRAQWRRGESRSDHSRLLRDTAERCQRCEPRGPGLRPRALGTPRHEPIHMQRRGRGHVWYVGFCSAPIPGGPQPVTAPRLGQRPFHPSAPFLLVLALLTLEPHPRRVPCLVRRLRWDPHAPSRLLRPGADRPRGTCLTVFERKLDEDRPTARPRAVFPPGR